ncbi:MAG TPA: hypothetical protein VN445_07305 [Rectinemataceae bacterium]|nr:hypothetical protein [Rectinemataceae bacterium]
MSDFSYAVVSSILHDGKTIDAIFSAFEPLFSELNGRRVDLETQTAGAAPTAVPPFFFILTGGTEGIVLKYLSGVPKSSAAKPYPLVLIAHSRHNSLPAALEIAARARQDGGSALVIQVRSAEDASARAALLEAVALNRAIAAMRSSRIGAVGEPSDWLVASSQKAGALKSAWGASLEPIAFQELKDTMEELRKRDISEALGSSALASHPATKSPESPLGEKIFSFLRESNYKREPVGPDMYRSDIIYRALRSIIAKRKLDALTLRCFDLLGLEKATGCYALSQLADDGIDAGCEGDIPSILALRWMRLLSGRPAWMANPSEITIGEKTEKGRILLAHCTVPRSLLAGYGIRSHFESGLGVAIAGVFAPGPVTLARVGGVALDKVWIAEGQLSRGPADEGLCRTQAYVEMDNADMARLLEKPLGNHLVVGFGHWAKIASRYLSMENLEEV